MEIKNLAILTAFLLVACTPTSTHVNTQEPMLSICVIDLSHQRMPSIGADVGECKDAVDVAIDNVEFEEIGGWFNLTIAVKPESQPKLEAFLTRNLKKQAVLNLEGRSLINMLVISNEAKELQFIIESKKEAAELQKSLK